LTCGVDVEDISCVTKSGFMVTMLLLPSCFWVIGRSPWRELMENVDEAVFPAGVPGLELVARSPNCVEVNLFVNDFGAVQGP
jgi:hypothetical protein